MRFPKRVVAMPKKVVAVEKTVEDVISHADTAGEVHAVIDVSEHTPEKVEAAKKNLETTSEVSSESSPVEVVAPVKPKRVYRRGGRS